MKMKMKLFLSGLMLLALSLMTISCQKDDEPLPVPVAAFTPSKTTATVGEAITFTNESTDATSYTWSFGDGTTSTDRSTQQNVCGSRHFYK
jgi:PKD repeat protein